MMNNGTASSISITRHELWVEEKVFQLAEQIFKAVLQVLQILLSLQGRLQTMDAPAAAVSAQPVHPDIVDCPKVLISNDHGCGDVGKHWG